MIDRGPNLLDVELLDHVNPEIILAVRTFSQIQNDGALRFGCLTVLALGSCAIEIYMRFASSTRPQRSRNHFYAMTAICFIISTYASEIYFSPDGSSMPSKDDFVYQLSQMLFWTIVLVGGASRQACAFSALTLLLFDAAIAPYDEQSTFPTSLWVIGFHRALALLILTLSCVMPGPSALKPGPNATTNGKNEQGDTGEIHQEDDDSPYKEDPWLQRMREKQRISSGLSGNWWEYLKVYRILIPYVLPRDDRKLQIYLGMLLGLLLLQRALGLLFTRQLGIVTDALIRNENFPLTEILVWMLLRFLQSCAGISALQQWLSTQISAFSRGKIKKAAFNHIMSLSMDFHIESQSHELIRAVSEGAGVAGIFDIFAFTFLPQIADSFIAFAYLLTLFGIRVTLITLLVGVLHITLSTKITSKMNKSHAELIKLSIKESATIDQAIQGWQTVCSFNRIPFENDRVRMAVENHQKASWRNGQKEQVGAAIESLAEILFFFIVIFIAALEVTQNRVSVSSFVILFSSWDKTFQEISGVSFYYRYLRHELLSAEKLLLLLLTKPSVVDKAGARDLSVTSGSISFRDVHFSYDPRKETLCGISLLAQPGQTIALVGETGAGKSTMLKLLYRFYDITSGEISIDGQDISSVTLSSLRESLGIVDQQPYLFNVSLTENLRYARLDATDEEIHSACKAAAIHDKIMTFPDGYDSVVGNRGLKLSGGELQRVAIARVLLKNPKIVLLDEATSSVDTDTEVLIQDALRQLTRGRTTFVIAHRLSTIVSADQVLVFRDGKIIQRGTHTQLAATDGKYKSLWSKQVAAPVLLD